MFCLYFVVVGNACQYSMKTKVDKTLNGSSKENIHFSFHWNVYFFSALTHKYLLRHMIPQQMKKRKIKVFIIFAYKALPPCSIISESLTLMLTPQYVGPTLQNYNYTCICTRFRYTRKKSDRFNKTGVYCIATVHL